MPLETVHLERGGKKVYTLPGLQEYFRMFKRISLNVLSLYIQENDSCLLDILNTI